MNAPGIPRALSLLLVLGLLAAACGGGGGQTAAEDTEGPAASDPADDESTASEPADGEPAAESDQTFKVGLFLPTVGPFAGIAEDQADGFRHYVEDLNDGVLSGYDVEIVEADTANDPAIAQENVQRLVERDEVDAIVGIISSAVAYAVAPYLEESGVPTISTAAAADDLTQRDHFPNFFRTSLASSQYMLPLGTYACEELGYETAAMVSLDYSFGWEAMGGFARSFEDAGCEIVQELYSPLGTADWGPIVQQIDREVDVVVQTTTGPDALNFLQAYRDFGLSEIPMLANGASTDPSSLPEQPQRELATGNIRSAMYYAEAADTPENQEFQASFREQYGYTPGLYAEAPFVAAMVLEAALADIEELDAASLTSAIAEVELADAPRGPLRFDEYGQAIMPMYLREMTEVNGELENQIVDTIAEEVTQFWTYDPEEYLQNETYIDLKGTWAN